MPYRVIILPPTVIIVKVIMSPFFYSFIGINTFINQDRKFFGKCHKELDKRKER